LAFTGVLNALREVDMDRNEHIKEYLKYYVGLSRSPGYAVLLNGAWGIGKTFLVKRFAEEELGVPQTDNAKCINRAFFFLRKLIHKIRKYVPFLRSAKDQADGVHGQYIYISLYGVASVEEIDRGLFCYAYLNPVFGEKIANSGNRLAGVLLKKINLDFKVSDFLKIGSPLFIFDDLERCKLPIEEVFGYINTFVEHEGKKVVLIANEEEIVNGNNEKYLRIREKLVGMVLEVQSSLEEAIGSFIGLVENTKAKKFLEQRLDDIYNVYWSSTLGNLRILRQTILDFERLFCALDEKHIANEIAMADVLGLFFALSFEVKAVRLEAGDLRNRLSGRSASKESNFSKAQGRYPGIRLYSTIFSDGTLVDLMIKGIVDKEAIFRELEESSFFVTGERCWRTVWLYFERTEEKVDRALEEMERAFREREFVINGEILHVFGLRLWLSRIGSISQSLQEVISECKHYIDDLYEKDQIEPFSPEDKVYIYSSGSHAGLSFHEIKTEEFKELFAYLDDKQRLTEHNRRPEKAKELLRTMSEDPPLFSRRINPSWGDENGFYKIPIFASIPCQEFCKVLLSLHPAERRYVLQHFQERYRYDKHNNLSEERPWAKNVYDILKGESDKMSPISQHLMQREIDAAFGKFLEQGIEVINGEVVGSEQG
jgi:DNA polymerase III delta prime subunit